MTPDQFEEAKKEDMRLRPEAYSQGTVKGFFLRLLSGPLVIVVMCVTTSLIVFQILIWIFYGKHDYLKTWVIFLGESGDKLMRAANNV